METLKAEEKFLWGERRKCLSLEGLKCKVLENKRRRERIHLAYKRKRKKKKKGEREKVKEWKERG